MTKKPIYLGVHPEYQRRKDIEIQTSLLRADIKIVYYIPDLIRLIVESQ